MAVPDSQRYHKRLSDQISMIIILKTDYFGFSIKLTFVFLLQKKRNDQNLTLLNWENEELST